MGHKIHLETWIKKITMRSQSIKGNWSYYAGITIDGLSLNKGCLNILLSNEITSFEQIVNLSESRLSEMFGQAPRQAKNLARRLGAIITKTIVDSVHISELLHELAKQSPAFLDQPVDVIGTTRLVNALKRANILTLDDLSKCTEYDVRKIPSLGTKSIAEMQGGLEAILPSMTADDTAIIEPSARAVGFFDEFPDEALDIPIALTSHTLRARFALKNYGVVTYRDLKRVGFEKIRAYPQVGSVTIRYLKKEAVLTLGSYQKVGVAETSYSRFVKIARQIFGSESATMDVSIQSGFELIKEKMVSTILEYVKRTKAERPYEIFYSRHGSSSPKTLEELGHVYGVTRERIRQIDEKVQRSVLHTFADYKNVDSSEPEVNSFYETVLFVGEDLLPSLMTYLVIYKSFEYEILAKTLKKNGISFQKRVAAYKRKTTIASKTTELPETWRRQLTRIRFYQSSDFVDSLRPINYKEYAKYVVKHQPSHRIEKITNPITARPSLNGHAFGRTEIDGVVFDGMLTILDKFAFMILFFDNLERMLSDTSRIQIEKATKVCQERGLALAVITQDSNEYYKRYSSKIASVTSKQERVFLETMKSVSKDSHGVYDVAKKMHTTGATVIAIGLKLNCSFRPDPLSVWQRNQNDKMVEESMLEAKAIKVAKATFTKVEKTVFLACHELSTRFLDNSSRLYFSTIRVFLTAYKKSFLYADCKDYVFFGSVPKIRNSELKEILNKFVKYGLFELGVTNTGKTYFIMNTLLVDRSGIVA